MDSILTLTHATERDVDLLLVEELKCSAEFMRWIADKVSKKVGGVINVTTSGVTHSRRRTYNRREIDICVSMSDLEGLSTYLLIENKLDTKRTV